MPISYGFLFLSSNRIGSRCLVCSRTLFYVVIDINIFSCTFLLAELPIAADAAATAAVELCVLFKAITFETCASQCLLECILICTASKKSEKKIAAVAAEAADVGFIVIGITYVEQ